MYIWLRIFTPTFTLWYPCFTWLWLVYMHNGSSDSAWHACSHAHICGSSIVWCPDPTQKVKGLEGWACRSVKALRFYVNMNLSMLKNESHTITLSSALEVGTHFYSHTIPISATLQVHWSLSVSEVNPQACDQTLHEVETGNSLISKWEQKMAAIHVVQIHTHAHFPQKKNGRLIT